MSGDSIAELSVSIDAKESVSAVLSRLESQLDKTNTSVEKIAAGMGARLGGAQAKARSDALTHAQALATLRARTGDLVSAEALLSRAIGEAGPRTTAVVRAETQLAGIRKQLVDQTRNAAVTNKSFASSILQLAGPLGIATTGIGALIAVGNKVKEGFDLRATLDEQRRTIGTLLGDVQKGNTVFQQAADFGRKYGFTQKEMGESAAAAAPLIKSSTTAVEKQLEVLARLASLNSKEGFTGATFSTKELASGDITSIVERFNIARSAANQMKAEIAAGADVFQVLDAQLSSMGVTVDVLANRTQGAAGATRTYAQAQEDLALALGRLAEGPGVQVIDFLSKFTNTVTNLASSGNPFATQAQQAAGIESQLVAASTSYADYGARIEQVNAQIDESFKGDPIGAAITKQIGGFQALTPIQFAYAQSLIQTGTAASDAVTKAQSLADVASNLALLQTGAARQSEAMGQAFSTLAPLMLQVASAGPDAAAGVQALALGFLQGDVTAEQFRAALEGQIAATQRQAAAAQQAAAAEAFRAGEHQLGAAATQANSNALSVNTQDLIENIEKKQDSTFQSQKLAEAEKLLAQLGSAVANGQITAGNGALQFAQAAGIATDKALELINAQAQLARAAANTQALIDHRAGERDPGSSGAAEAAAQEEARLQSIYRSLQDAPAKAKKGAGGTKLSDQQKLNNQLQAGQDAANNKFEDAETQHQQRLLDIQAEFARKQRDQQKANEISKRQSQADFYDRLTSSELNKSGKNKAALQKIDADYQAAYQKSQELAQSGNAKLAADYLALKQKQADQELAYQEALAKAAADKDQAEISRLQAIHALRAQANAEEEKQLLENGDANVNARDQALADEQTKYESSQDKIALSAERAADRQIAAAQRAGKVIDEQQLKIDKLGTSYDRIAPGASGSTAGTTSAAPAASTDQTTAQPQSPADIVAAVNAAKDAIVAALSAVERAEKDTGRALRSAGNTGGIAG